MVKKVLGILGICLVVPLLILLLIRVSGVPIKDMLDKVYYKCIAESSNIEETEPTEEKITAEEFIAKEFISDNNIKYYIYNALHYNSSYKLSSEIKIYNSTIEYIAKDTVDVDTTQKISRCVHNEECDKLAEIDESSDYYIAEDETICMFTKSKDGTYEKTDLEFMDTSTTVYQLLNPLFNEDCIIDLDNIQYELKNNTKLEIKADISLWAVAKVYGKPLNLFRHNYDNNTRIPIQFNIDIINKSDDTYDLIVTDIEIDCNDIIDTLQGYYRLKDNSKDNLKDLNAKLNINIAGKNDNELKLPNS